MYVIKGALFLFLKVCYGGALTFVCCDETKSLLLSKPEKWKTLVERMDLLYVSGSHLQIKGGTSGEICGNMIMTTAAMSYLSKRPHHNFQPVRSRRQERLVEFLKKGIAIWMLSSKQSITYARGENSCGNCQQAKRIVFLVNQINYHLISQLGYRSSSQQRYRILTSVTLISSFSPF